jgi:hypothetical protein
LVTLFVIILMPTFLLISPPGSPTREEEPLLNSYTDYEDSIYGIAWSSHDPSLFASLSYDGRVVLESVKPYLQRK